MSGFRVACPIPFNPQLSILNLATILLPYRCKTASKMVKQDEITVKRILDISLLWFMLVNLLNDLKRFHTVEVTGSNPVPPTMQKKGLRVIP